MSDPDVREVMDLFGGDVVEITKDPITPDTETAIDDENQLDES